MNKTASEIRLEYENYPKLVDRWLEVGYRHWLKNQSKKITSVEAKLNERLQKLSQVELKDLKTKLRKSLRK